MLSKLLKNYRLDHNLSQVEMAAKLKTSQGYYSLLEAGNKKPGLKLSRRICHELNIDPAFLRSLK